MFTLMLRYRTRQQSIVDERVRLMTEVMSNIRNVKLYAYEAFFSDRIAEYRQRELVELRKNGLNRSTSTATMMFIPTLAAVCELPSPICEAVSLAVSFVTYALSGHTLDSAVIFSALQFFNVLRQPIAFLPMILSSLSDSVAAIRRIGAMLRVSDA